ncbi:MAG: nitrophenyl compound nitroreductase subunit ArsF family protein [Elusimicrobia bacterium]|nr:nitrophenyl compound nitroreductase subunit ArsF family protein [Candidatus Obscuribacterium magneticum]
MKKILTIYTLLFLLTGMVITANLDAKKAEKKSVKKTATTLKTAPKSEGQIIAYYFHGNVRCPTCHKLEEYAKEALQTQFKNEIDYGKLIFKTVNVEDKGNEHFAQEYQLYTKALIISLVKNGKEAKWKNLEKIWDYVGNKEKYFNYVKEEVTPLLKEI